MGISKLRIKQLLGKMSLSRAVLATIALVVLVQGEGSKDDFSTEMQFTQQGFSYEETAADVYGDYDASLKGQDGLARKLASAHEEEQTARRKDDDSSWTPSGQSGLSDSIDRAKEKANEKKLQQDGLKGDDVLASDGLSDYEGKDPNDDPTDIGDLNLVQLPSNLHKSQGGQKLQKSASQAAKEEEKKEILGEEDTPSAPKDGPQESIFGAVDIKIVKKEDEQDDELKKLGIIDTSDIKFNGPKGWLSEDDIKLLQIQH